MNSVNRRTKLIISRLLTAVFLFVILSTIFYPALPAMASDVSGNESNEEDPDYDNWEDALEDSDFMDSISEKIANLFTSYYTSYNDACGDSWDDIADVVDPNGTAQYYYDKYNRIVDYINPFVNTYLYNEMSGSGIKPITPKQIKDNDMDVLTDIVNDFTDSLPDLPGVDDVFSKLPKSKENKGLIRFSWMPEGIYISINPIYFPYDLGFTQNNNTTQLYFKGTLLNENGTLFQREYVYYEKLSSFDDIYLYFRVCTTNGWGDVWGRTYSGNDVLNYVNYSRSYYDGRIYTGDRYNYRRFNYNVGGNWAPRVLSTTEERFVKIYGDCFFIDNDHESDLYFWDSSELKMYYCGKFESGHQVSDPRSGDYSVFTQNIYNDIDFETYSEYISDLLVEVTEGYTVNNQLLIELLKTISQQNNNYVQNDDDTIDDFLNDLKNRLQDTIEVNLTIPDITPDLSGIANALAALLNFLASIIRAIGDIVSSLLDGLFHLFVPTTDQWAELTLDFDTVMNPFRWIRGFLGEGVNAISTCLFGSNVTDITSVSDDLETVNASVSATRGEPSEHSSSHANIVYDEETGAPKIPVHFSNSTSEYFSDIGDAYIIDMNWYAPFKPVGDVIVVAFCWIMFIWRVIRDLPGIINGTSGITDNNPDSYSGEVNKQSTWHRISGR